MGVSDGKEAIKAIDELIVVLSKKYVDALLFAKMAIGYRTKKKPKVYEYRVGKNKEQYLFIYYGCPSCKEGITDDEYDDGYHFEHKYDVCHKCGQLIDWTGIDGIKPYK